MRGLLLIDKPMGWTSFDAVNKVRRLIEAAGLNHTGRKRFPVGHTGTLDPMATGLLVLLLGEDTRRAQELTKLDKTYEVTMRLGQTSTTGDEEGEKQSVADHVPSHEAIGAALAGFVGESMQTPPRFSAIKVNGHRAYKLAREGKAVELEARPVKISRLELTTYDYPFVRFTADVSSGTYIRSLVEDLGKMLETGAYMSALRRTKVGPYGIEGAISPENLTPEFLTKSARSL
ncbi:MAG TPA: tRNA pseudouridine(55) synthase TruB [Candidatus Saccharimonadales bacterium]|nr:tRNA pseudouridine(55) synthase TruB [Candidatus Saccharimonadales bacterium]